MSGRLLAVALAVLLAGGAFLAGSAWQSDPPRAVALFTSLPILWRESDDISGLLASDAPPHWARAELEAHGPLVALDTLLSPPADAGLLVIAQPRPLSPQENVALDGWVRKGGHVLLFADPLLTRQSAFALGDRRRPQDTVLLSPILARWGLRLEFDEQQALPAYVAPVEGMRIPVNLPGRFAAVAGEGKCTLSPGGLLARCRIGRGRLVALADAAVLEEGGEADLRRRALAGLLDLAEED